MSTPREGPGLGAAEFLTDTLDLSNWVRPVVPSDEGDLAASAMLAGGGSPGLQLLAEIARVHWAAQPVAPPAPTTLFEWGHLQVTGVLGRGSYGEVYSAWDPRLQREVALKLVRARAGTLRWLDEARGLARVHHPNVLTIHGADLRDDRAGLWTEKIRGRTLEEELSERGRLPAAEVARIGHDLASALAAVHAAGLVHGDLKTSNVMLEEAPAANVLNAAARPQAARPTARVVLMDFGTARLASARGDAGPLTTTPLCAAPEVLQGASPTASSDVYSAGVVLYRLLTGRWPVESGDLAGLMAAHAGRQHVPLMSRRAELPGPLVRIVERATAPDPLARIGTSAELRDALGRLLGERRRVHPVQLALTVAALSAVAALTVTLDRVLAMRDTNRIATPPAPTLAMSAQPWWASRPDTLLGGMGWAVSAADFDRDGRADLLVVDAGYSRTQLSQGRALVFRGGHDGLGDAPAWAFEGRRSNDLIGASVSRAGDVDGDGFEDALVRDPSNLMGGAVATGAVLLFRGSAQGLGAHPAQVLPGDTPGGGFGNRVGPAGDVNGDGFDDVLISQHNWSGEHRNQGRVLVYLGGPRGLPERPSQILVGDPMSGAFGWDVNGVGDVNHDGFDDVMVGSGWWQDRRGEVGALDLFLGGTAGLKRAAGSRITGDRDGDAVGNSHSAEGIGDVNGDGYGDVVVGVQGHDGRGAGVGEVRVYLGRRDGLAPRPVWRAEGYGSGCYLGFAVARARDVDGDGRPDLVVSGYGFSNDRRHPARGAVFVYRGAGPRRLFERRPAWWATVDQSEALFGAGVDLADVDGDGLADVVVGAPHWRNRSITQGRLFVFRGARGVRPPAGRAPPRAATARRPQSTRATLVVPTSAPARTRTK